MHIKDNKYEGYTWKCRNEFCKYNEKIYFLHNISSFLIYVMCSLLDDIFWPLYFAVLSNLGHDSVYCVQQNYSVTLLLPTLLFTITFLVLTPLVTLVWINNRIFSILAELILVHVFGLPLVFIHSISVKPVCIQYLDFID